MDISARPNPFQIEDRFSDNSWISSIITVCTIHKRNFPKKKHLCIPKWIAWLKTNTKGKKRKKRGKKMGVLYCGGVLFLWTGSWRTLLRGGLLTPCEHYIHMSYIYICIYTTYLVAQTWKLQNVWTCFFSAPKMSNRSHPGETTKVGPNVSRLLNPTIPPVPHQFT